MSQIYLELVHIFFLKLRFKKGKWQRNRITCKFGEIQQFPCRFQFIFITRAVDSLFQTWNGSFNILVHKLDDTERKQTGHIVTSSLYVFLHGFFATEMLNNDWNIHLKCTHSLANVFCCVYRIPHFELGYRQPKHSLDPPEKQKHISFAYS